LLLLFVRKMKALLNTIPENAFLTLTVGLRKRRLYFKDVRMYKKTMKPHPPRIPSFDPSQEWAKSAVTDVDSDSWKETESENGIAQTVLQL
jgi:hypothetical protein